MGGCNKPFVPSLVSVSRDEQMYSCRATEVTISAPNVHALQICYNALDRHVSAGFGSQPCLLFEVRALFLFWGGSQIHHSRKFKRWQQQILYGDHMSW
jgi:hypothetical protein